MPSCAAQWSPTDGRSLSRPQRSFGIDVLQCKDCGGALTLVDIVMNSRAIQGILKSIGLPTEPPLAPASRAPPDDPYDHYDA